MKPVGQRARVAMVAFLGAVTSAGAAAGFVTLMAGILKGIDLPGVRHSLWPEIHLFLSAAGPGMMATLSGFFVIPCFVCLLPCDLGQSTKTGTDFQCWKEIMKVFLAVSPFGLAVFDSEFRCQILNATLAAMIGHRVEACIGKHVDAVFCNLAPQIKASLQQIGITASSVLDRELTVGEPGPEDDNVRYWTASFFPVVTQNGRTRQFLIVILDITPRKKTEEALTKSETLLRTLSGRLLNCQDEERRRLARELHDSIGQQLAALKITLDSHLSYLAIDSMQAKVLSDSVALVEQCERETRTIAYLLHPPLLDQMGLPSALRWYVDGFATRSGIDTRLDVSPEFTRLSPELETTLFRIVQESLTNIHRHSGSPEASIRLTTDAHWICLEVRDQGHGIPTERLQHGSGKETVLGMGIAGMNERVRQFGGKLTLSTSDHGTTVTATLPIRS